MPFLSALWRGEQPSMISCAGGSKNRDPVPEDFVFLGIDQKLARSCRRFCRRRLGASRGLQLMAERPFPWSRELWALLLDKLFAAGARLVIFDMVFNPPNDGDPAFAAALERYRDRVVIGQNFDDSRATSWWCPNAAALIRDLTERPEDCRVGYVNFCPMRLDGRLRAVRFAVTGRQLVGTRWRARGEEMFVNRWARALAKARRADRVPRDLQRPAHSLRSDIRPYEPRPLWHVFLIRRFWQQNYADGAFFKDKVIMIGASAQIQHDIFDDADTVAAMPGPVMHLHAIAAAIDGRIPPRDRTRERATRLVGAAGFSRWPAGRPAACVRPSQSLLFLGLSIAYLAACVCSTITRGLLLLTCRCWRRFCSAGGLSLGFDYVLERMEKLRTRRTLERYVSKNLVKEILDNPGGYYNSLKGVRKPVTVVFSDLIGFTTLSERADPEELVRHLNEYLSAMVGVVFEHGGTLDKFIGDAIMAVWGNVRSAGMADDAKAAARAALGMRKALKKLNDRWRTEGRMGLGMGVGINQGEAIVGNIGSYAPHERLDPTVIGDAVNLASRLEALTRNYGIDILVGASAADLIRDDFHLRSVARVQVKGKTVPVEVSTLIAAKGETGGGRFAEVVGGLRGGDREISRARVYGGEDPARAFSRVLSHRSPRQDVPGTRAGIRTAAAG